VGDCIAICLLVKDTIKALDSAHGSASEYQAVTRELWALDRALLEVVSLQESVGRGVGHTKELNALFVTVGRAVQQCKGSIERFLITIKGYERSLASGQVGLWKGVKGKVSWALLRKDDLNKFRAEVNAHSSAINMLLITASV
jgi:predicted AlkP superfamily phosphohydrolase/phosphomutase